MIAGCATASGPQKQDPILPTPSQIKTITDSNEIGFEWASLGGDENVSGVNIYRLEPNKNGYTLVGKTTDRYATHYVDSGLKQDTQYYYELRSYSAKNVSAPSAPVSAKTRPNINSVPFAEAITGLPERVKLIWRPHPDSQVSGYVIQRADALDGKYSRLSSLSGRLNAEYIDSSVKSGHTYYYIIYAITPQGLSNPSEPLKASTKPLPPSVVGLKASKDEPKRISLSWQASPVADYYQIYRSPSKYIPYIKHAKTSQNSFIDEINSNDSGYFYQVSVVDKDGLESLKKEAIGRTLPAPDSPKGLAGNPTNSGIMLSWQAVPRAVKYRIYKSAADFNGLLAEVSTTSYTDTRLAPDASFIYSVSAVDANDISSSKSNSIKIRTNAEF